MLLFQAPITLGGVWAGGDTFLAISKTLGGGALFIDSKNQW